MTTRSEEVCDKWLKKVQKTGLAANLSGVAQRNALLQLGWEACAVWIYAELIRSQESAEAVEKCMKLFEEQ